jgi:hypothetical protein
MINLEVSLKFVFVSVFVLPVTVPAAAQLPHKGGCVAQEER